jgi:hypothetical protein
MAITENTYTGNGSLTEYSFTFPYLEESDVKVSLDGTVQPTTEYSFANATTISFNTAPANGVAIRIYRETSQEAPPATFFAGSAIRASDLNENFLQQLYVAQETSKAIIDAVAGDIPDGTITSDKLASNLTIDLASGTADSPSLTFDENTGLYSPGEDQVAISTNGTERARITSTGELQFKGNGTNGSPGSPAVSFNGSAPSNSLVIDSSGNLGLGTSSPSEQLQLGSGNIKLGLTGRIFSTDGTRGSVQISAPNESTSRRVTYGNNYYLDSDLAYKQEAVTIGGSLIEMTAPNNTYGSFKFIQKQDPDLGGATRDALVIDYTGNVGIGTTSPGAALDVVGNITATGDATIGSLNGGPLSGARNRIINGDMRIDQRNDGASVSSGINSLTYTVDRWSVAASNAAVTVQRLGTAAEYYLNVTGAASVTACNIRHRIESKNIADLAGSTVTLSFKCSSSSLTSLSTALVYADSVDNFATGTVISSVNISITSTPTIYSTSFSLPANAANGVQVIFSLGAFTSGTFTLTDVQLEPGSIVTPFERRSYGDELALCQRYYESIGATYSIASQANVVNFWHSFKVTKRADPTVTGSRTFTGITVQGFSAYTDSSTTTTVDNASAEL